MNLEDIKDQLIEALQNLKEQIKDSSLYTQLKERFDLLSPRNQKYVMIATAVFIFYIVISIPIGFLSEAADKSERYVKTTKLLDRLRETKQLVDNAPSSKPVVESNRLSRSLKSYLEKEGYTADQIKSSEAFKEQNSGQIPGVPSDAEISGVKIELSKLNLKQIVSVLYNSSRQSRPGKMTHLEISPFAEEAGFFDLKFEIRNFEIPIEESTDDSSRKRSRRNK